MTRSVRNAGLQSWLDSVDPNDVKVPLNVIFEIQMGIAFLRRQRDSERATKADRLEQWLQAFMDTNKTLVLDPIYGVIKLQARMSTTPSPRSFIHPSPHAKSRKVKIGGDLIVAATAIAYNAAIINFNVDDFLEINRLFPLPGLFHPGRREWLIGPGATAEPPKP